MIFSFGEAGGLWVASHDSLDPWFEAVAERYENGVCEQLALYASGAVPDRHAGIR